MKDLKDKLSRKKLKRQLLFQLFVVLFITLFCALGTWQLYRLQWKMELISEINFGLNSTPIKYSNSIKKNYQRVVSEGSFNYKDQIYFLVAKKPWSLDVAPRSLLVPVPSPGHRMGAVALGSSALHRQ